MIREAKNVLITGGTGSFGNAFIRRILSDFPNIERIVVFSRDEYKQFLMSNLPEFKDNPRLRFFIGDVRDKDRLLRALDGIDLVIHAAALKQVPSCEYNPFEAIKTNILGAQNVIEAAIDCNVKRVIALSTDKACAPVNLYGATKLCSDKLFIAANVYVGPTRKTRFSVVRYGNVAGSRGSVIPYFKHLIDSGHAELPITDFEMTRFWLKLEDAVEMVVQAFELMQGGELFVKKVPSMRVIDLAKAIAPAISLKHVGIRPGEKIHEVMITGADARNTYEFDDFFVIKPEFLPEFLGARSAWKLNGGKIVDPNFEYNSGKNSEWLSIDQMQEMINEF